MAADPTAPVGDKQGMWQVPCNLWRLTCGLCHGAVQLDAQHPEWADVSWVHHPDWAPGVFCAHQACVDRKRYEEKVSVLDRLACRRVWVPRGVSVPDLPTRQEAFMREPRWHHLLRDVYPQRLAHLEAWYRYAPTRPDAGPLVLTWTHPKTWSRADGQRPLRLDPALPLDGLWTALTVYECVLVRPVDSVAHPRRVLEQAVARVWADTAQHDDPDATNEVAHVWVVSPPTSTTPAADTHTFHVLLLSTPRDADAQTQALCQEPKLRLPRLGQRSASRTLQVYDLEVFARAQKWVQDIYAQLKVSDVRPRPATRLHEYWASGVTAASAVQRDVGPRLYHRAVPLDLSEAGTYLVCPDSPGHPVYRAQRRPSRRQHRAEHKDAPADGAWPVPWCLPDADLARAWDERGGPGPHLHLVVDDQAYHQGRPTSGDKVKLGGRGRG